MDKEKEKKHPWPKHISVIREEVIVRYSFTNMYTFEMWRKIRESGGEVISQAHFAQMMEIPDYEEEHKEYLTPEAREKMGLEASYKQIGYVKDEEDKK